jgi:hypothetical protein
MSVLCGKSSQGCQVGAVDVHDVNLEDLGSLEIPVKRDLVAVR